jgi:ABC-type multidrug transport system ATPase subunit
MSSNNERLPALQIRGLTKSYGGRPILDKLDLRLPTGAMVGLLGPNGAGKTTLLRLVAGLLEADKGQIEVVGYDLQKQEAQARRQLAYVPDTPNFYPELTLLEHLELMARAHTALENFQEKAEELLRRFGLWEVRNSLPFTLSRGMSQKLALCCALVRPSKILLLDEPGGTLDIKSVNRLYQLLVEYRDRGGLVVLSSHQWETLQDLCDLFVLLDQGQVLATGDLPFLREAAELSPTANLREIYLAFTGQDEEDFSEETTPATEEQAT